MLLVVAFTFSGCSWCEVEVPVYIEATCPVINTLAIVPPIEVIVDSDGNISSRAIHGLINGVRQLRQSEDYYYEQVSKYNEEFTKTIDK